MEQQNEPVEPLSHFHRYIQPRLKNDPEFLARWKVHQAAAYQRAKPQRRAKHTEWRAANIERARELGRRNDKKRNAERCRVAKLRLRYQKRLREDVDFAAIEQQRAALYELAGLTTPPIWKNWKLWADDALALSLRGKTMAARQHDGTYCSTLTDQQVENVLEDETARAERLKLGNASTNGYAESVALREEARAELKIREAQEDHEYA